MVIYGFYDFTEGQKQLLQACADSLGLTAFMPWRETLGFVYAFPTLNGIENWALKLNPS